MRSTCPRSSSRPRGRACSRIGRAGSGCPRGGPRRSPRPAIGSNPGSGRLRGASRRARGRGRGCTRQHLRTPGRGRRGTARPPPRPDPTTGGTVAWGRGPSPTGNRGRTGRACGRTADAVSACRGRRGDPAERVRRGAPDCPRRASRAGDRAVQAPAWPGSSRGVSCSVWALDGHCSGLAGVEDGDVSVAVDGVPLGVHAVRRGIIGLVPIHLHLRSGVPVDRAGCTGQVRRRRLLGAGLVGASTRIPGTCDHPLDVEVGLTPGDRADPGHRRRGRAVGIAPGRRRGPGRPAGSSRPRRTGRPPAGAGRRSRGGRAGAGRP